MSEIKVRFAPSPTGPLHIGGARSALFNWLYARRNNGKFVVRIEDTDIERSSLESEQNILASLRWLGLDWDEGIEVGGPDGPYRQTQRQPIYEKWARKLLESGHAYHCYCSEEELAAQRQAQLEAEEMVRYTGDCRHLTPQQQQALAEQGRKPVIRFKVPGAETIRIQDMVRGQVNFDCDDMGDYIIVKSDGIPTYNFAVAIDDHLMGITHVIRAEEHLSNTPRQILIFQALNLPLPHFAHVSLILGQDRSKMSKRHGATSIEQYQKLGYLPGALVNFLALLGWSSGTEEEVFTLQQISDMFSLDRVAKSPAVFDLEKLNWLNGHYIKNTPLEQLALLAAPFLQQAGFIPEILSPQDQEKLLLVMAATRDYLDYLDQVKEHAGVFYQRPAYHDPALDKVLDQDEVPSLYQSVKEQLNAWESALEESAVQAWLKKLPKQLGLPAKKVYLPLRVGLTGKTKGPELYQLLPALGRREAMARLDLCLQARSSR